MKNFGPHKENTRRSFSAKVELRCYVLAHVRPARVLDAFCGYGLMYREAWNRADNYTGCDSRSWGMDEAPRYVCDNRRLLRCLDLSGFNLFDFDAFGSPWEQVIILAKRRKWISGETGGLVVTDGSTLKTRWGELPRALAMLIGSEKTKMGATTSGAVEIRRIALKGFAKMANVKIVKQWEAIGPPPACLYYASVVFEGL